MWIQKTRVNFLTTWPLVSRPQHSTFNYVRRQTCKIEDTYLWVKVVQYSFEKQTLKIWVRGAISKPFDLGQPRNYIYTHDTWSTMINIKHLVHTWMSTSNFWVSFVSRSVKILTFVNWFHSYGIGFIQDLLIHFFIELYFKNVFLNLWKEATPSSRRNHDRLN